MSIHVTAKTKPSHIEAAYLGKGKFDVMIADNIAEETVTHRRRDDDGETTEETRTVYGYDRTSAVVTASDYGSFIAAILHMVYSTDDEAALINKAIADPTDEEYTAYRAFVSEVKTVAAEYFDNE